MWGHFVGRKMILLEVWVEGVEPFTEVQAREGSISIIQKSLEAKEIRH